MSASNDVIIYFQGRGDERYSSVFHLQTLPFLMFFTSYQFRLMVIFTWFHQSNPLQREHQKFFLLMKTYWRVPQLSGHFPKSFYQNVWSSHKLHFLEKWSKSSLSTLLVITSDTWNNRPVSRAHHGTTPQTYWFPRKCPEHPRLILLHSRPWFLRSHRE